MRAPLLLTLLSLSIGSVFAADDATPPNVDSLLKEITAIEQKREQSRTTLRNAVLTKLQAGAASGPGAINLYTDAVEAVRFEGKKEKAEAFMDWKKQNADAFRARPTQEAAQLYFRYAILGVQRKATDKPETLVAPTLAYVNDLVKAAPAIAEAPSQEIRELLSKPMGQSVVAQSIGLQEWLPDDKTWEQRAGDVAGILEKNIRPILRATKSPQLLQTWDLQMQVEADRITTGRSAHEASQFNTVTRPKVQFQKAQDMVVLGQPNRAVGEMITLIRTYPDHPDFANWVRTVRGTLNAPAGTSQQ